MVRLAGRSKTRMCSFGMRAIAKARLRKSNSKRERFCSFDSGLFTGNIIFVDKPNCMLRFILALVCCFFFAATHSQAPVWISAIGGTDDQIAHRSEVDVNGNIYVIGNFAGSNVDFDPSPTSSFLLSSSGDRDIFVAKYASNGAFRWAFKLGGTMRDGTSQVALDNNGSLFVTGYFRGPGVDFDPSPATAILNSAGEAGTDPGFGGEAFLAKYDTSGNYQWAFRVGGSSINDLGVAIAVDGLNNVIFSGYFRGTIDFDPGAGSAMLSESGGTAFVAKYTPSGQYLWAFNFGAASIDNSIWEVETDNANNIYISAFFQGVNIDMDPTAASFPISSNGQADIVIAKYTPAGALIWAKNMGGTGWDRPFGLVLDGSGNVYFGGYYSSTSIDLDPGPATAMATGTGAQTAYVVKLNNSGLYQWSAAIAGTGNSYFESLEIDNFGNLVGAGTFSGTIDLDQTAATANLVSAGAEDGFVVKYSPLGAHMCSGRVGGSGSDAIDDIEVTGSDVILTGHFAGSNADLNPTSGVTTFTATNAVDAFISKNAWTSLAPSGTITGATVCTGQPGQLTFTASGGAGPFTLTINNGSGTVTYNNIVSGTPFTPNPAPTVNTIYTLTSIKDANNCAPLATVSTTANINFITITPSVSAAASICPGDSTQLTASGGTSYSWSPATGLSAANIANPKAAPATNTTYTVTVTGAGGCTATATVAITIRPKPVVSLSPATAVCIGDSTQLTATGGSTYLWSPSAGLSNAAIANPKASPATTTTYQALVTGSNGCKDSASVTIGVNNKPVISLTPNTSICSGDSLQLNATGGGVYQWSPTTGLNNSSIAAPKAAPATTTIYQVLVLNAAGCRDSARTTVTVTPKPIVNLGPDTLLCATASLSLNATTAGATLYTWSNGANSASTIVNAAGTYSVAVQVAGCTSPARDTIVVGSLNLPTVALGADQTICSTDNLVLSFQATNATSFVWSNGSTASTLPVTASGNYTITVQNACGTAQDQVVVTVNNCNDDIYFPSAITPNQDGRNEGFKALHAPGVTVADYKLTIYNRWGNRVFQTTYLEAAWGGTINGERQMTNTFVFYAEYRRTPGGPLIKKKGTFVVIR
ncbi:MAG: T9SS type B sorting domain-containing protein [Chitinophagaceae bacterium]|nr:MAG: T9SS type B sorting domain-containing protein [Chitinophagaceae bacterium]